MSPKASKSADLEEIAPNLFLLHTPRVGWMLKGEGERLGRRFELHTWRRDGLLARIRANGFRVVTLEDRVAALPDLPDAPPLDDVIWRPLIQATERLSYFDSDTLLWQAAPADERNGVAGVLLRIGWVIRRRKGRGVPIYYLSFAAGNGIRLEQTDESGALLHGYAQAAAQRMTVAAEQRAEGLLLPRIEIPHAHQVLLRSQAHHTGEGLIVEERAWPLAQAVFERLGVELVIRDL